MNLKSKNESETLEFKKSIGEWKDIIETASAFSNTRGGEILVGINNSGEVNGVEIGKNTLEDLTNKIKENTDPEIQSRIATRTINNKTIIVVRVKESNDHLVLAFGRPYKRVGKSTVRMSKDEYESMILEKHKEKLYFDSQICERATIADIDEEKIKWFLRKVKEERNLDIKPTISPKEALRKLNLLVDNKLTKAAILIFGKIHQKYFIQSEVRCARFKRIKAIKPFIDMKVIGGSVYEQIDQTEKFVLFNIKKSAWIQPVKIERQEKWEYPPDAIREAITNAIAHRDYNSSANVHISIYDDRVEVWNPGRLPQPLTPDDLKREHKSIPINPSLANLLFLIKYIERWGTGTNDIIKQCKEYELPEPVFKEAAAGFTVILRKLHIPEDLESIELNERQKKVIEYLKKNKRITNREYQNLCPDVNRETLRKDLIDLINKKTVVRKGERRGAYYEFI